MTNRDYSKRARHGVPGVLLAMTLAVSAAFADADEVAIAAYVQIEVEVRMLTNASLQQRRHLQAGDAGQRAAAREISQNSKGAILQVYSDLGMTPSSHAAFGTRNAEAIDRWLAANPQWQQLLDQLSSEFDSLVASFGRDSVR